MEVVHIDYDPEAINYEKLLSRAKAMECTSAVYTYDDDQFAAAKKASVKEVVVWKDELATRKVALKEQKYYLRGTVYGHLPLTEAQAVKANSMLMDKASAQVESVLSPRQIKLRGRIQRALMKDRSALDGLNFPVYGELEPAKRDLALIDYDKSLRAKLHELEKQ